MPALARVRTPKVRQPLSLVPPDYQALEFRSPQRVFELDRVNRVLTTRLKYLLFKAEEIVALPLPVPGEGDVDDEARFEDLKWYVERAERVKRVLTKVRLALGEEAPPA